MVLAGIDTAALTVKVYDPAPVGVGQVEWWSLATWHAFGTSPSIRDTSSGVKAVFLHVPG